MAEPKEVLDCNYENLAAVVGQAACDFVKESCTGSEVFDAYKLRYCVLSEGTGGSALFFLICLLVILASFYLLGKIASVYLTPVLTKVSTALKMSETLAGVTLLAFANGAPDIITSYTAGESDGGIFITIGNLCGAGLFCSTVVISRCIQVSKREIVMEAEHWMRDLTFYIMTTLLLLTYSLFQYIDRLMAAIFLIIYAVYIIIVIYQDKRAKRDGLVSEDSDLNFEQKHSQDKKMIEEGMHKIANHTIDIGE